MTKLIRVGFFSEMPHGDPSDPSLADARAAAGFTVPADVDVTRLKL